MNEAREEFNSKQRDILYNFQEIEFTKGKLNSNLIGIILQNQKNQIDINQTKISKFESIKNNLNINRDIKNMLIEYKSKEKPDGEIFLINFNSDIDFDKCENEKDFLFNVDCIKYIQSINKEEYPKYNYEIEKTKNDMRILLAKMFDNNESISPKDKEALFKYISNPETHYLFLILLSKSRTNNRFCQSKNLIEILGEILNKILDNANKNNNYSFARICVVLAQTFFYTNEKEEKIFILESIKNNPWMKNIDFWINYTEIAIKEEIEKIVFKNNPEITMDDIINESEKINEKIKRKISEIIFSQLLPCINNMKDFNINNNIIINVVDDILYKYNYLNEENTGIALGFISDNTDEIQKIRNENAKNHKPKIKIEEEKTEILNKSLTKSIKSKFTNITSFFSKNKNTDENNKSRKQSIVEPVTETKQNIKEEKKEIKEVKEDKKIENSDKSSKIATKNSDIKKIETNDDKKDNKSTNINKTQQENKNNISSNNNNTKKDNKFPNNNTSITKNAPNASNNTEKNKITINKTISASINYNDNLLQKNNINKNNTNANTNTNININLRKTLPTSFIPQSNNESKKDDKYSIFNVKLKKLPSQK